jgi:hypothetical protein
MSLGEDMARLRARVDVSWSDERARRVLAGMPARAARKRRRRLVAASVIAAIVVVGAAAWRDRTPLGWHSVDRRRPIYANANANANGNANANASANGNANGSWRDLAARGDWSRAHARLRDSELRDEPDELLLAAEVARRSGHAAEALPPLKLILDQHARSARAAQAAMLYGRVLLDDLGRAREAAAAFSQVRQLPGHQGLDEDALAREAEAWWRAGDGGRAQMRAREYLRRYPDGAQLGSVRRYDPRRSDQP